MYVAGQKLDVISEGQKFWNISKDYSNSVAVRSFQDLTRISIPVVFNEPLSFLQRLAEYMEYAELLEKASKCMDATERFEVK